MLGNQLVVVVLGVEIEQVVLLTEHLAALVELTHADAYVVQFGIVGDIDDLLLGELDIVHLTEGGEEADRLNDSIKKMFELRFARKMEQI